MTENTLVAALSMIGVLGAAALAWLTAAQARTWKRLTHAEATNQALWTYTRVLIDAHYRGGLGPPPPPPDYIAHIYDIGENT